MSPFLRLLLIFFPFALGFDASWTPSDPDGPLPLSKNYRSTLRKLCRYLRTEQKVPPQVQVQQDVLIRLCKKLRQEDKATGWQPGNDSWFDGIDGGKMAWGVFIGGIVAYYLYFNYQRQGGRFGGEGHSLRGATPQRQDGPTTAPFPSMTQENIRESMRQARLRRFQNQEDS